MPNQSFGFPPYIQSNNVGSNYNLNGELPPEIAAKQQTLNRKQQIANLLLQQGIKGSSAGSKNGRFYVPQSYTEDLAGLVQTAMGAYLTKKNGQAEDALGQENQKYTADAIQKYMKDTAGTAAVPEQPGAPVTMEGTATPFDTSAATEPAPGSAPPTPGPAGTLSPPGFAGYAPIDSPRMYATVGNGAPPDNRLAQIPTGVSEPNTPAQPAVPASPQQKQAAMMELLAKRIPGAQNLIAMQQHQDQLQAQQAFQEKEHAATAQAAKLEHDTQREFLHGENQTKIAADLIKARGQIDTMVQLGMMKAEMGDQIKRDLADQSDALKRDIAKGHDATQLAIAKMGNQTKENVAATKQQQKGKMPAAALKMQNEELDAIGSASSINADLKSFEGQIDTGKLDLGMLGNWLSKGKNFAGMSDEQSRNFASFNATMEKSRNASLLLNKGVQTEGDAVRAWNELFANMNDKEVVKQRLQEIQRINERAVNIRKLNVDNIRKNYGLDSMETEGYTNQQPAVGGGGAAKIASDADYEKLPSGSMFIGPDGKTRKKP